MELKSIEIKNFRSIKELSLNIEEIENSKTFSLIGINESGKSSILKAISLFHENSSGVEFPEDFYDENIPIELDFIYSVSEKEKSSFIKELKSDPHEIPEGILSEIDFKTVKIGCSFDNTDTVKKKYRQQLDFKTNIFSGFSVSEEDLNEENEHEFNLTNFVNEHSDFWFELSNNITFWKASPEYLILDGIDLQDFLTKPISKSIPLFNCFQLTKYSNPTLFKELNSRLNSPVEIRNLEDELSDKVTNHIKKIWPEHPIRILFTINENKISLLVEDDGVKYKAKTTGQRSDGFKQFISFLLTVSVQNKNRKLKNSILLIDEPETHLHPKAQLNILKELISLTANENNNVILFATHSNYLIDKGSLSRCFKVTKKQNSFTEIEKIKNNTGSYSEVNFEVFDIPTSDYHNELYGYLEDVKKEELSNLKKEKNWINIKTNKTEKVSLPTYIRHSIHHPENTSNKPFSDLQLRNSIELMRAIKFKAI